MDALSEDLKRWFKEKWVDISRKTASGKHPPCGRKKSSKKGYPKCRPSVRVSSETPETTGEMSQSEKKAAVRQKRTAEATRKRKGKKPIMTSHRNIKEEVLVEKNVPTNKKLYSSVKALAKKKFKVYPSAYANAWLVKTYKARGGKYKSVNEATDMKDTRKEAIDMAMSELMKTQEYAGELLKMMSRMNDVEPWIQGKITTIGDYIGSVKHYLEYRNSKYGRMHEDLTEAKKDMPCNKPTRSTSAGKKMMVKACEGGKEKIVHFGAKGYGHNYSPAARKSFRARHKCGQSKSKLSAQYWACKKLWAGPKGSKASCPPGRKCKY
jgi:hypothetical protein